MRRNLIALLGSTLLCLAGFSSAANDATQTEMRSLDEQVQEIKSDVLAIAAELNGLEERLLFPSNTQVSVFLSIEEGETFRLDSVQLGIDDKPAAHHIYSFKDLEALQRGGVQRLFVGNLTTGQHSLEVAVLGKLASGKDYRHVQRFSFDKDIDPGLLAIKLAPESGGAAIRLQDW